MGDVTPQNSQSTDPRVVCGNGDISGNHLSADDSLITLNVGGCVTQTRSTTLKAVGVGRLASLSPEDESYLPHSGQYFFDRDPDFFARVIRFYRTGELHIPENCCARVVREELAFWQLSDTWLADCCWRSYSRKSQQIDVNDSLTKQFAHISTRPVKDADNQSVRTTIWNILECPSSSLAAKVISPSIAYVYALLFLFNTYIRM